MTSLTRKTSTSGHIGGTLVAAAVLLLPAALLTPFERAAAEEHLERPDITVYHSNDPAGADPRSETVPPGCDEVSGEGEGTGGWVVVIGDVNAGPPQGNNTVFYSNILEGGSNVLAVRDGDNSVPAIKTIYSELPGVTLTQDNTTVTTELLDGVDLLLFTQNAYDQALVSTSGERLVIETFIADGGNLLLIAETDFHSANFNVFLSGIGSTIQYTTTGRSAGSDTFVTDAPFTVGAGVGIGTGAHNVLTGGTPIANRISDGQPIAAAEQVGSGGSAPVTECVLAGGTYEELKLWIDGGSTASDSEVEDVCSRGDDDSEVAGGSGHELCGVSLTFQIQGVGRFKGAIENPEADAGIDTLVLGTTCTPQGDGGECFFPVNPPLKQLTLNFRRGDANPGYGPRFIGTLITDSTGTDPATDVAEYSVYGEAAGAALQLRPISTGENPEIIATLPEPSQIVQMLTGLFGLAALQRVRRKHE